MDVCDDCGFEYEPSNAANAAQSILAGVAEIIAVLADGADLCTRRSPQLWSPLEYGCHVRDVLLVQRERILAARRLDRTTAAPMGREERVDHDGYAFQDPRDVARQLDDAGRMLANVLSRLGTEDWARRVSYNYPIPTERSLRWVAVHTVHEVHHHLEDIRNQLT